MKTTVITGLSGLENNKKILFLSYCFVGRTHDYTMLKEDFPPDKDWFKNFNMRLDSGYQGFAKDYKCRNAYLPAKARKKQPLNDQNRLSNRQLSSQRVGIEHSIGRLKRYRVMSDRLRMRDFERYDDTLEVCAGLWNFYATN